MLLSMPLCSHSRSEFRKLQPRHMTAIFIISEIISTHFEPFLYYIHHFLRVILHKLCIVKINLRIFKC